MLRNWEKISEIGNKNRMLMLALGSSTEDDSTHERLIKAFPECFSGQVEGAIPLSVIRSKGDELGRKHLEKDGALRPGTFGALEELAVPFVTYDIYGRNRANADAPRLPESVPPRAAQGTTVYVEGEPFVVLENNPDCEEMILAPAARVDASR